MEADVLYTNDLIIKEKTSSIFFLLIALVLFTFLFIYAVYRQKRFVVRDEDYTACYLSNEKLLITLYNSSGINSKKILYQDILILHLLKNVRRIQDFDILKRIVNKGSLPRNFKEIMQQEFRNNFFKRILRRQAKVKNIRQWASSLIETKGLKNYHESPLINVLNEKSKGKKSLNSTLNISGSPIPGTPITLNSNDGVDKESIDVAEMSDSLMNLFKLVRSTTRVARPTLYVGLGEKKYIQEDYIESPVQSDDEGDNGEELNSALLPQRILSAKRESWIVRFSSTITTVLDIVQEVLILLFSYVIAGVLVIKSAEKNSNEKEDVSPGGDEEEGGAQNLSIIDASEKISRSGWNKVKRGIRRFGSLVQRLLRFLLNLISLRISKSARNSRKEWKDYETELEMNWRNRLKKSISSNTKGQNYKVRMDKAMMDEEFNFLDSGLLKRKEQKKQKEKNQVMEKKKFIQHLKKNYTRSKKDFLDTIIKSFSRLRKFIRGGSVQSLQMEGRWLETLERVRERERLRLLHAKFLILRCMEKWADNREREVLRKSDELIQNRRDQLAMLNTPSSFLQLRSPALRNTMNASGNLHLSSALRRSFQNSGMDNGKGGDKPVGSPLERRKVDPNRPVYIYDLIQQNMLEKGDKGTPYTTSFCEANMFPFYSRLVFNFTYRYMTPALFRIYSFSSPMILLSSLQGIAELSSRTKKEDDQCRFFKENIFNLAKQAYIEKKRQMYLLLRSYWKFNFNLWDRELGSSYKLMKEEKRMILETFSVVQKLESDIKKKEISDAQYFEEILNQIDGETLGDMILSMRMDIERMDTDSNYNGNKKKSSSHSYVINIPERNSRLNATLRSKYRFYDDFLEKMDATEHVFVEQVGSQWQSLRRSKKETHSIPNFLWHKRTSDPVVDSTEVQVLQLRSPKKKQDPLLHAYNGVSPFIRSELASPFSPSKFHTYTMDSLSYGSSSDIVPDPNRSEFAFGLNITESPLIGAEELVDSAQISNIITRDENPAFPETSGNPPERSVSSLSLSDTETELRKCLWDLEEINFLITQMASDLKKECSSVFELHSNYKRSKETIEFINGFLSTILSPSNNTAYEALYYKKKNLYYSIPDKLAQSLMNKADIQDSFTWQDSFPGGGGSIVLFKGKQAMKTPAPLLLSPRGNRTDIDTRPTSPRIAVVVEKTKEEVPEEMEEWSQEKEKKSMVEDIVQKNQGEEAFPQELTTEVSYELNKAILSSYEKALFLTILWKSYLWNTEKKKCLFLHTSLLPSNSTPSSPNPSSPTPASPSQTPSSPSPTTPASPPGVSFFPNTLLLSSVKRSFYPFDDTIIKWFQDVMKEKSNHEVENLSLQTIIDFFRPLKTSGCFPITNITRICKSIGRLFYQTVPSSGQKTLLQLYLQLRQKNNVLYNNPTEEYLYDKITSLVCYTRAKDEVHHKRKKKKVNPKIKYLSAGISDVPDPTLSNVGEQKRPSSNYDSFPVYFFQTTKQILLRVAKDGDFTRRSVVKVEMQLHRKFAGKGNISSSRFSADMIIDLKGAVPRLIIRIAKDGPLSKQPDFLMLQYFSGIDISKHRGKRDRKQGKTEKMTDAKEPSNGVELEEAVTLSQYACMAFNTIKGLRWRRYKYSANKKGEGAMDTLYEDTNEGTNDDDDISARRKRHKIALSNFYFSLAPLDVNHEVFHVFPELQQNSPPSINEISPPIGEKKGMLSEFTCGHLSWTPLVAEWSQEAADKYASENQVRPCELGISLTLLENSKVSRTITSLIFRSARKYARLRTSNTSATTGTVVDFSAQELFSRTIFTKLTLRKAFQSALKTLHPIIPVYRASKELVSCPHRLIIALGEFSGGLFIVLLPIVYLLYSGSYPNGYAFVIVAGIVLILTLGTVIGFLSRRYMRRFFYPQTPNIMSRSYISKKDSLMIDETEWKMFSEMNLEELNGVMEKHDHKKTRVIHNSVDAYWNKKRKRSYHHGYLVVFLIFVLASALLLGSVTIIIFLNPSIVYQQEKFDDSQVSLGFFIHGATLKNVEQVVAILFLVYLVCYFTLCPCILAGFLLLRYYFLVDKLSVGFLATTVLQELQILCFFSSVQKVFSVDKDMKYYALDEILLNANSMNRDDLVTREIEKLKENRVRKSEEEIGVYEDNTPEWYAVQQTRTRRREAQGTATNKNIKNQLLLLQSNSLEQLLCNECFGESKMLNYGFTCKRDKQIDDALSSTLWDNRGSFIAKKLYQQEVEKTSSI